MRLREKTIMESKDTFNQPPATRPLSDTAHDDGGHVDVGSSEREALTQAPPDPFGNDQGIEYWLWNGVRLVPAWPDEIERIHERARLREEQFQAELRRQRAERRFAPVALAVARLRAMRARLAQLHAATRMHPEPSATRQRPSQSTS